MGINGSKNHHQARNDCQGGKNKPLEHTHLLLLNHPADHNRNIHCVNRNDWQFRRIKVKQTKPTVCQVCAIEIQHPGSTGKQAPGCGVVAHVGNSINLLKGHRLRSLSTAGDGIHTAGRCNHQAIQSSQARNNNADIQKRSTYSSENIAERSRCSVIRVHQHIHGRTATNTDIVHHIGSNNN